MTTVAYKDGVIAADTMVTCGQHIDGFVTKIAKHGNSLCGASGVCSEASEFLKWFSDGQSGELPKLTETNAFIVRSYGCIEFFNEKGRFQFRPNTDSYSIGSGSEYAIGAMAHGATAEEAVKIAVTFDANSGGSIETLSTKD